MAGPNTGPATQDQDPAGAAPPAGGGTPGTGAQRGNKWWTLVAVCLGGGNAVAMIIERA